MSRKTGIYMQCFYCKKEIYVPGWKLKPRNRHYCSQACHYKQQSLDNFGINNIMFKYKVNFKGCRNPFFAKKHSLETKNKIRLKCIGNKRTLGIKQSLKARQLMSIRMKQRLSNPQNHPMWKGGIQKIKRPRNTTEYKFWRKSIFLRDNYTCRICGTQGGYLEAHHIKSWINHPGERFNINNGLTVHRQCHPDIGKERKLCLQEEKERGEKENGGILLITSLEQNI
jgi:5-methylcytosine-specific restriction endonuclease McrA